LEKRGERGGVTAAKVKEGKSPPGKSRANRPLQLLADFAMEHIITGDLLVIGVPVVEELLGRLHGHSGGSLL
jgi:hypothetical protein